MAKKKKLTRRVLLGLNEHHYQWLTLLRVELGISRQKYMRDLIDKHMYELGGDHTKLLNGK